MASERFKFWKSRRIWRLFLCLAVLVQAGTTLACSVNDVTIIDFTPVVGSTGDDPVGFAAIDGTLDSTCPTATNVSLTITAQTKTGTAGSRQITVTNVPPGGIAFSATGLPYTEATTGYEVTVSSVSGQPPFRNTRVQTTGTGNPAVTNTAAPQTTSSVANQAGNFVGSVAGALPWYYRR